jgi:hypothetical protein
MKVYFQNRFIFRTDTEKSNFHHRDAENTEKSFLTTETKRKSANNVILNGAQRSEESLERQSLGDQ